MSDKEKTQNSSDSDEDKICEISSCSLDSSDKTEYFKSDADSNLSQDTSGKGSGTSKSVEDITFRHHESSTTHSQPIELQCSTQVSREYINEPCLSTESPKHGGIHQETPQYAVPSTSPQYAVPSTSPYCVVPRLPRTFGISDFTKLCSSSGISEAIPRSHAPYVEPRQNLPDSLPLLVPQDPGSSAPGFPRTISHDASKTFTSHDASKPSTSNVLPMQSTSHDISTSHDDTFHLFEYREGPFNPRCDSQNAPVTEIYGFENDSHRESHNTENLNLRTPLIRQRITYIENRLRRFSNVVENTLILPLPRRPLRRISCFVALRRIFARQYQNPIVADYQNYLTREQLVNIFRRVHYGMTEIVNDIRNRLSNGSLHCSMGSSMSISTRRFLIAIDKLFHQFLIDHPDSVSDCKDALVDLRQILSDIYYELEDLFRDIETL